MVNLAIQPIPLIPLLDRRGRALDYNVHAGVSVNRWLKFVAVLVIAGIVVAVVSPEFTPQPTGASFSKATHRTHLAVAFAVIQAASRWVPQSTPSPLAVLFQHSSDCSTDLIALYCTRLC